MVSFSRYDISSEKGSPRFQRRLAAILGAEVVGYSRLMRRDEEGTLERMRLLRIELFDPIISQYSGRILWASINPRRVLCRHTGSQISLPVSRPALSNHLRFGLSGTAYLV
jgi:class 3 adenylate cyclase